MKNVSLLVFVFAFLMMLGASCTKEHTDLYSAVSADAAIVLDFQNTGNELAQLTRDSIWNDLSQFKFVNKLHQDLTLFDSLFKDGGQSNLFNEINFVAALHRNKGDDFAAVYVFDEPQLGKLKPKRIAQSIGTALLTRKFEGIEIYEVRVAKGRTLAVASANNLVVASFDAFLLESALKRIGGSGSTAKNDPYFQQAKSLSKLNGDLKAYINFKKLPDFLSIYLNASKSKQAQGIEQYGEWGVLDYVARNEAISLRGYVVVNKEKSSLLKMGKAGNSSTSEMAKILPYNTAVMYGVNSADLENYLRSDIKDEQLRSIYEQYFLNWMGSLAAYAILEPLGSGYVNQQVLVVSCGDEKHAQHQLNNFQQTITKDVLGTSVPFGAYNISNLGNFNQLGALLGYEQVQFDHPYYVFIDEYVVFANELSTLKILIERYTEQQTLSRDIDYLILSKNISASSNVSVYANVARNYEILKQISSPAFSNYLESDFDQFKHLNPVGLQFSEYQDNIYLLDGIIQSRAVVTEKTSLLWKTTVDGTKYTAPKMVINHKTKQKEIFVQDEQTNIYLIDAAGQVIWKRKLGEEIIGDVHMVDRYKNRKYQYLFASKNALHLVDRNGNDVEGFPLRIPKNIIQGVACFDYNRNGDYRVFVDTEQGNVYGFKRDGTPLPGWSPHAGNGDLAFPVQHFISKGKDYLLMESKQGEIKLVNRRGELRDNPIKFNQSFAQQSTVDLSNAGGFTLYNADRNGKLFTIKSNGIYKADSVRKFRGTVRYLATDITGDEALEHVVADNAGVYVFDKAHKPLWNYVYTGKSIDEIQSISLSNSEKKHIGIVDSKAGKIYLLTGNGNLLKGFPLRGSTPFTVTDLVKDKANVVVVGAPDNTISAYQLGE